jgi:hypothetical protein
MKLLLLLFPLSVSAFSIRSIIESKLVVSTVLTEINNEFSKGNIIITDIPTSNSLLINDLCTGLVFVLSIYLQYANFMYIEKKLSGTSMYSDIQEKTKLAIYIFTIVFTKSIENAI